MTYLYHRVPRRMLGPTLVPLSKLKVISADLYFAEVSAYKGRTEVLDKVVLPLGCPQRDTIFFSLVHPQELLDALRKAGIPRGEPLLCFQIPARHLRSSLATIRYYNQPEDKIEFDEYTEVALEKHKGIPPWTSDYYRTCKQGDSVFYWKGIPQILYNGTLNINGLPVVEGR